MAFTYLSALKFTLVLLVIIVVVAAFFTLPIQEILNDVLVWIEQIREPWGPVVLAVSYIPLTILAVPASILTLGGGFLFGLPIGIIADSVGSTIGSIAAFYFGKTIGRSYVTSRLKDYPQFQAVDIAIRRSGFKIVFLLRLAPMVPFNLLNYVLSMTPVGIWDYTVASWLGMLPLTIALVYIGTTLKDLSDATRGWSWPSSSHWVFFVAGLVVSVVLMVYATKVAKIALDKAMAENLEAEKAAAENLEVDTLVASSQFPLLSKSLLDIRQPLIVKVDPSVGCSKA